AARLASEFQAVPPEDLCRAAGKEVLVADASDINAAQPGKSGDGGQGRHGQTHLAGERGPGRSVLGKIGSRLLRPESVQSAKVGNAEIENGRWVDRVCVTSHSAVRAVQRFESSEVFL